MIVGGKHIFIRRGFAWEWDKFNPVLPKDEPAVCLSFEKLKIGDGETPWMELPYATAEEALDLLLRSIPKEK